MIFDKKWNHISREQFVRDTKNEYVIIFGMSPRNDEILKLVEPQNIQCFYDNKTEKWGYSQERISIKKPEPNKDAVIVTAGVQMYQAMLSTASRRI